jgi:hydrogenase maturation factor
MRGILDPAVVERAASLLTEPGISVVPEAMAVLDAGGVSALHDPTEGGLATGVRELALAADCGATVEREAVPVLPETEAIAGALDLDPLGMLASGSLHRGRPRRSRPTDLRRARNRCPADQDRRGDAVDRPVHASHGRVEQELRRSYETDEIGRAMTRRTP